MELDRLSILSNSTDYNSADDKRSPKSNEKMYRPGQIPEAERCTLAWKNLEYFIPLSAERRALITDRMSFEEMQKHLAAGDEEERGFTLPKLVQRQKGQLPHQ